MMMPTKIIGNTLIYVIFPSEAAILISKIINYEGRDSK